ncbi:hypothetical protein PspLS_07620 [Pyricularia sp. CBS 133598]|nr:hypothetical protein PspLS_07620 [Pyricularia sp. CBS 133598]
MSIANGEDTISHRSRQARQRFVDIIEYLASIEAQPPGTQEEEGNLSSSDVEDVLGKFDMWAGNLGAFRAPETKLSLDQRLAVDPEIRGQICVDLGELLETLDELLCTLQMGDFDKPEDDPSQDSHNEAGESGSHQETIDDDIFKAPGLEDPNGEELEQLELGDTINEAKILLDVINEYLRSLFRVGMLVRNAGTRDRFDHALQVSTDRFEDFADIDYLRHKSPKLSRVGEEWLLKRLGSSNTKRRQVLKYYRDHKNRLAADGTHDQDLAPTLLRSSKATTFVPQPRKLENFDEDDDDNDATSLASASTTSSALATLRLPRLSELSPDGEPFECPICFILQAFKKEKSWKSHAFGDLKAYTCTAGQECKDLLFSGRNSWFEHELHYHRSTYKCFLCSGVSLPTHGDLKKHFLQQHPDLQGDQVLGFIEQGRQPLKYHNARDCPFCDDWAEHIRTKQDPKGKGIEGPEGEVRVSGSRFRRHVAAHLEQLAIFSMARATEDHDIDGKKVSGADSPRSTIDAEQVSDAYWSEEKPLATDYRDIFAQIIWSDTSSSIRFPGAFGAIEEIEIGDTGEAAAKYGGAVACVGPDRGHTSSLGIDAGDEEIMRERDPEYVLIKRWVPEEEQEQLWRHTRLIREKRGSGASSSVHNAESVED